VTGVTHPLIPTPVVVTTSENAALLLVAGSPIVVSTSALLPVARTFVEDVERDTGLALGSPVVGGSGHPAVGPTIRLSLVDPASAEPDADDLHALPAERGVRADGSHAQVERYGLEVRADGVELWAFAPEGVHRGLTTLRQLISAALQDGVAKLRARCLLDAPRFTWRGLSLDVARTFHDVPQVLRVIDMLSVHKLNVLHLHLTDDQGWRLDVPGWPLLTEVGGAGAVGDRPGGHYTAQDVRTIVAYAAERFVTVVPEIDVPGHTQAVLRSYPELGPAVEAATIGDAGALAAGAFLDPDLDVTWRFMGDVLSCVAELFTTTRFVHVGGDEAFGMSLPLHAAFVDRATAIVRELGLHAVGWQETARGQIARGDLAQYWIDQTEMNAMIDSGVLSQMLPEPIAEMIVATMREAEHDVDKAVDAGAGLILSPTSHLYYDRPHAEAATDEHQEAARLRVGLPFYPRKSAQEMFTWDPDDLLAAATERRGATIAGVEAAIWCETVEDGADLELLLLPRLAGLAERSWAPRDASDWAEHRERLAALSTAWERRGWAFFRSSLVDWQPAPTDAHVPA
jgi:hexosaminidase